MFWLKEMMLARWFLRSMPDTGKQFGMVHRTGDLLDRWCRMGYVGAVFFKDSPSWPEESRAVWREAATLTRWQHSWKFQNDLPIQSEHSQGTLIMNRWVAITISGLCSLTSFFLAFLAYKDGRSSAYLFSAFALFFLLICLNVAIGILKGKGELSGTNDRKRLKPDSAPTFVPHRFVMAALIAFGIVVLLVTCVSLFR